MSSKAPFVVLIVLDGWGVAPRGRGNAISLASTPRFDGFLQAFPTGTLHASGELVGLPWGEMGNSEAGHLNIGSGRIYYQPLPYINKAISDGSFFKKKGFLAAIEQVKKAGSSLHLMGLLSDGGVHSFINHLYALLELCQAKEVNKVFVHAFLDGRDTAKDSGILFVKQAMAKMKELGVGKMATLSGRTFAMDRDQHWDRTEKAYRAIAEGVAEHQAEDPVKAVEASYARGVYDEEFEPTVITENGKPVVTVSPKDAMIFFNFRADRARQITKAFTLPGFEKIKRKAYDPELLFVTMMEYELELPVEVAFEKVKITTPLAKVISDAGLKQFHIAETEKYAHVTFFFNGGIEAAFPGEDRELMPSPHVATFDQKPEMAAREVAEHVVEKILSQKYQFLVLNFANADMVGHTGNLKAAVKAIEALDRAMGEIADAVLHSDGALFITGDHGNAEEMINGQNGDIIKEHSTNPVPLIYIREDVRAVKGASGLDGKNELAQFRPLGILADVAPTILSLLGLPKPKEMQGHDLLPALLEGRPIPKDTSKKTI